MGDIPSGTDITFDVRTNKDGHPQARDVRNLDGRPAGPAPDDDENGEEDGSGKGKRKGGKGGDKGGKGKGGGTVRLAGDKGGKGKKGGGKGGDKGGEKGIRVGMKGGKLPVFMQPGALKGH